MNEFELIARLTRNLPANASIVAGAGDDCAVLDLGVPDKLILFKTDAVVEGIHFLPDTQPRRIGHKALARCLSDVAAMGGRPLSALITLALPKDFDAQRVMAIYDGINELARRYGVSIAGGETTTNPERMLLSIAMLGDVPRGKALLRSGSRAGDAIFVTGELGGSILGKHLDFEPRLEEAQWLAAQFNIHAMIDLSDGLASDLRHILKASGIGGELLAKSIPISRAARQLARASHNGGKTPLSAALGDGEDFELLFCAAGADAVPLLDAWKDRFPGLRLTCIGKITAEPGLKLRDNTGLHALESHGYVHFA